MDYNDKLNMSFIKDLIEEGDILVDVGACLGDYTKFYIDKLGTTGLIYSLELYPSTYNRLNDRFKNHENVIVLNLAASDVDGEVALYKGIDEYTNNIIGHDMNFKPNQQEGKIASTRLDTLLKRHNRIKMVKIDVEGAEYRVLKSMKGIIRNIDYILLECHLNEDWPEIRKLLLSEYQLDCVNIKTKETITLNSPRPYQCLCRQMND